MEFINPQQGPITTDIICNHCGNVYATVPANERHAYIGVCKDCHKAIQGQTDMRGER